MGYAAGFMNVVEVYGPQMRTGTIGETTDSYTRFCHEHPEAPPQVTSLGVISEFQADKPMK